MEPSARKVRSRTSSRGVTELDRGVTYMERGSEVGGRRRSVLAHWLRCTPHAC